MITTAAPSRSAKVRTSRTRALVLPLGSACAVTGATVVLYRTDGYNLGPLSTCWFHAGTGLYCPFCGSLRGVAALSHADVLAALHNNAPVMLLLGVAGLIWVRRVLLAVAGKVHVDQPRINGIPYMALAALFVIFTIYRNTRYGAWLAPLN